MKRDERERDVIGLLLTGAQRMDLEDLAAEEGWKKGELDKALESAIEYFEEIGAETWEARRGWCISALQDLFRKCSEVGDYTAALRCIVEISKLSKGVKGAAGAGSGRTTGQGLQGEDNQRTAGPISLRSIGKGRR